jgi:hypothetical protein
MNDCCRIKRIAPILWQAAALIVLPVLISSLLIRNLGYIVGLFVESGDDAKFDFAQIFMQTRDARLVPCLLIPIILALAFVIFDCFCISKINCRVTRLIVFSLTIALAFILSFAFSLMLTRVNGVRFFDLLAKLIPLIDKL